MIKRYKTMHDQRKSRTRHHIQARAARARLSVFRSNKYVYAQVIDDKKGMTVAAAYGKSANDVGEQVAKKAVKAGVKEVVFDRGFYRYHGRVKQLADAARKGGLAF